MKKKPQGFAEIIPIAVMRKLREAVAPPGKRGTWLRYLDDNRLAEVFVQLQSGTAAHHIASIAQREWGIKPESKTESLARSVRTFKDKVIGEIQKLPIRKPEDKEARDKLVSQADKVAGMLNELEEMGWVLREQKTRIVLFREKEDQARIGFAATDKAIQIFKELLSEYSKMKVNLGLTEPPASEFNLNIKHRFDGLMKHTIGEDGEKVVSALDRFMELAEERSLTLSQNPDGTYSYKEDTKEKPNEITTNAGKKKGTKGSSG